MIEAPCAVEDFSKFSSLDIGQKIKIFEKIAKTNHSAHYLILSSIKSFALETADIDEADDIRIQQPLDLLAGFLRDFNEYAISVGFSHFQDSLLDSIWYCWILSQSFIQASSNSSSAPFSVDLPKFIAFSQTKLSLLTKRLCDQKIIPPDLAKERLDADLLQKAKLIPSAPLFNKKLIRANTNNLYKQIKFNLHREANLGYSRLIAIITSSMLAPEVLSIAYQFNNTTISNISVDSDYSSTRAIDFVSSNNQLSEIILKTLSELEKTVGMYSIDPCRVVDITLDMFFSNVENYWLFFLALFEKSARWNRQKYRSTLAQLLGQKLVSYHEGSSNDNLETPEELIVAVSMLIHHNMIDISEIYPYLYPPDEEFSKIINKTIDDLYEPKPMSSSMLAMMAPLGDSDAGEGSEEGESESLDKNGTGEIKERSNQKLVLCTALLGIGDLKNGMFIVSKFSKLVSAFPQVSEYISRIILVLIEPVYSKFTDISKQSPNMGYLPRLRGCLKSTKTENTLCVNPFPPSSSPLRSKTVYFYKHSWKEKIPHITNPDTLPDFIISWLSVIGPHLSDNTLLLTKLIRLCKSLLFRSEFSISANQENKWLEILRVYILPSISRAKCNPALLSELWKVLEKLSYRDRYLLYGEWQHMVYSSCSELKRVKDASASQVRAILRRLSRDTVKTMGRKICKVTHMNPLVSLPLIIERIGFDDNLIDPLVESFRFLTDMGIDVLMYVVISTTFDGKKPTVKENGVDISHWLSAISRFISSIIRRYPSSDPGPLLVFLAQKMSLVLESSFSSQEDILFEFEIFGEILIKIAGIEPMTNPTLEQLEALQGGQCLRTEAYQMAGSSNTQWQESIRTYLTQLVHQKLPSSGFSGNRGGPNNSSGGNSSGNSNSATLTVPNAGNLGKGSSRAIQKIVNSLVDNGLTIPFIVGLSKQVQTILFGDDVNVRSLKATMTLYDTFHIRQLQFLYLFTTYIVPRFSVQQLQSEYQLSIPTVEQLHGQFGLTWSNSWMWIRPVLHKEFSKSLIDWQKSGEEIYITSNPAIFEILKHKTIESDLGSDPSKIKFANQYIKEVYTQVCKELESQNPAFQPGISVGLNELGVADGDVKMKVEPDKDGELPKSDQKQHSGESQIAEAESIPPEHLQAESSGPEANNSEIEKNSGPSSSVSDSMQSVEYSNLQNKPAPISREVSNLSIEIAGLNKKLVDYCRKALPSLTIQNGFLAEFFVVFWMLTMYDLDVPVRRYDQEAKRMDSFMLALSTHSAASLDSSNSNSLLSSSKLSLATILKEKDRANSLKATLETEQRDQEEHVKRVKLWLGKQSSFWFCMSSIDRTVITDHLFQHCIFPRAINSALDSVYVAHFIILMQFPISANMFPTLILCDRIFSASLFTIFETLTEGEILNYTRFLNILLTQFQKWQVDCALYKEQCIGNGNYHGFAQKWTLHKGIPLLNSDVTSDLKYMLTHENFIKVHFKWHTLLFKVFVGMIKSNDAELVRKSLLGLRMLSDTFPASTEMGTSILSSVKTLVSTSDNPNKHDYSSILTGSAMGLPASTSLTGVKMPDRVEKVDQDTDSNSGEADAQTKNSSSGRRDIKVLARAYIAILESKKLKWVNYKQFSNHIITSDNCFTDKSSPKAKTEKEKASLSSNPNTQKSSKLSSSKDSNSEPNPNSGGSEKNRGSNKPYTSGSQKTQSTDNISSIKANTSFISASMHASPITHSAIEENSKELFSGKRKDSSQSDMNSIPIDISKHKSLSPNLETSSNSKKIKVEAGTESDTGIKTIRKNSKPSQNLNSGNSSKTKADCLQPSTNEPSSIPKDEPDNITYDSAKVSPATNKLTRSNQAPKAFETKSSEKRDDRQDDNLESRRDDNRNDNIDDNRDDNRDNSQDDNRSDKRVGRQDDKQENRIGSLKNAKTFKNSKQGSFVQRSFSRAHDEIKYKPTNDNSVPKANQRANKNRIKLSSTSNGAVDSLGGTQNSSKGTSFLKSSPRNEDSKGSTSISIKSPSIHKTQTYSNKSDVKEKERDLRAILIQQRIEKQQNILASAGKGSIDNNSNISNHTSEKSGDQEPTLKKPKVSDISIKDLNPSKKLESSRFDNNEEKSKHSGSYYKESKEFKQGQSDTKHLDTNRISIASKTRNDSSRSSKRPRSPIRSAEPRAEYITPHVKSKTEAQAQAQAQFQNEPSADRGKSYGKKQNLPLKEFSGSSSAAKDEQYHSSTSGGTNNNSFRYNTNEYLNQEPRNSNNSKKFYDNKDFKAPRNDRYDNTRKENHGSYSTNDDYKRNDRFDKNTKNNGSVERNQTYDREAQYSQQYRNDRYDNFQESTSARKGNFGQNRSRNAENFQNKGNRVSNSNSSSSSSSKGAQFARNAGRDNDKNKQFSNDNRKRRRSDH